MKIILLSLCIGLIISTQIFSQWEWLNPRPHGNSNNRLAFGNNPSTYTVVGNAGLIMKTTNDGVDWVIQNSGTEQNLNDIYINGNDGIAVGNSGTILKTTDGGTTWTPVNTGRTTNLTAVAFPASNTGIITGWNGLILRTTNGGVSWDSIPLPFSQRLYAVSFADVNNGMVAADTCIVFRTTNGGTTWILQDADVDSLNNSLYDISYVSPTTAFASGWGGTIVRTTNGGGTWHSIGFTNYIRWGVAFTNVDNGVVVGDFNTIAHTTDGGVTWTSPSTNLMATNFHCVRFYNSTKGVAVGEWGAIFKTDDGGITWQIITEGVLPRYQASGGVNRNSLYSVHCINSSQAVIGGSLQAFVTNDGGVTWSSVIMSDYPAIDDVSFANSSIGVMLGRNQNLQGSTILKSVNGGSGWSVQLNSSSVLLNGIDLSTTSHGVAVGNAGKILRTTNSGQNWTEQVPPQLFDIYDVYLVDSLIGYTVGKYGNILKTTDGGVSWNQVFSNFSYNLRGVSFYDANSGIAVGEWLTPPGISHGIILKTTDGGSTWSSQNLDPLALPLFLEDVTFTDNNTWYAVGISVYNSQHTIGRIFKSQDAGENWFEQSIPFKSTRHMNAISSFDNNRLITVGLEGLLLGTINGGGTSSVEEISNGEIPSNFNLSQNYPNPFNPTTKIRWQSPVGSHQTLKIYDVLGNEVATLVDEFLPSGSYETEFSGEQLSSGIYFYRIQAGQFVETKKMILIR